MASILQGVLGPLLDGIDAELKANSAALLAAANAAGVKVIDEVANTVIDNLPHRGLAAIVAPFIRTAIADAEPQIIAALGGEEQALLALLEAQIALAASKFGG